MKAVFAAVALAAGVSATYPAAGNVTYTTEVVTAYETYCPGPTTITYGQKTYTVSKATTLTITDCPCTISKPVYTTSKGSTTAATTGPTTAPTTYATVTPPSSKPTTAVPTTYYPTGNSTLTTVKPTGGATTPTTYAPGSPSGTPTGTAIPTAGAGKAAAMSGAGLAGVLGLFAYVL